MVRIDTRPGPKRDKPSLKITLFPTQSGFLALVAAGAAVLCSCGAARAAAPLSISLCQVGDTGNAPDSATGFGEVDYPYAIGRYDVTVLQYTDFLNAVAKTDPYDLYDPSLGHTPNVGGIQQIGGPGFYTYSVIGESGSDPVTFVSWLDAARFCNWLQNGQPRTGAEDAGTTEEGAYALNGDVNITGLTGEETRNAWATWWAPSEDEWYKAAYYDPALNAGAGGYYLYATQSNLQPGNNISDAATLPNLANYAIYNATSSSYTYCVSQTGSYGATLDCLTPVGCFADSSSYYGTYDQAGDVWNWTDDFASMFSNDRVLRGGSWYFTSSGLDNGEQLRSTYASYTYPSAAFPDTGFRVGALANPANTFIGTWLGLLQVSGTSPPEGMASFTLKSSGSFIATLNLPIGNYSVKGALATDGTYSASFSGTASRIQIALQTAPDGADEVTGTVTTGGTAASFVAGREVFSNADPAPQAGHYTALIDPPHGPLPPGEGYATLTVGKAGGAALMGKLPDGESFSYSGALVAAGTNIQLLIYKKLSYTSVAVKGSAGALAGAMTFQNQPGSNFTGALQWNKPPQVRGEFPGEINTGIGVVGSLYSYKKEDGVLPGFGNGAVELSDTGALSLSGTAYINQPVMLLPPNKFTLSNPDPEKLKVSVRDTSGVFTGSFIYPGQKKRTSFAGVLFQDQTIGSGFFLGPEGCGCVSLGP
jgi:sulfatase modifying factor 1